MAPATWSGTDVSINDLKVWQDPRRTGRFSVIIMPHAAASLRFIRASAPRCSSSNGRGGRIQT
eukprot:932113-Pleurochrysis_carterae.AAC.1